MKLQNHKIKITGFTIVELIVTTGIFALITSMMLIRDAKFNSTVKLNNLTYEVALAVRQAQIFGTGVKEYGSGDFNVGYGVHFDTANNKSFVFLPMQIKIIYMMEHLK